MKEDLAAALSAARYVEERLHPAVKDLLYLHLLDLRNVLIRCAESVEGAVLDYGCGGAPYRALFRKAAGYTGADIAPGPQVSVIVGPDYALDLPNEQFDLVLSTQVLEHLAEPQCYLKEALRVLKPGGKLIVTTHGMFEEHGCPYDYRRWTAIGLRYELEKAGFRVRECYKLTTGLRAILFLLAENIRCGSSTSRLLGLGVRACRILLVPPLNAVGYFLRRQAVVPANDRARTYIALCAVAEKISPAGY